MNTTNFILEQKNPPKKLKPMHLHIAQWLIPVPLDPSRKKWLKSDSYVVFQTVDHARSCCKKQSLYWRNAWIIADEAANSQLRDWPPANAEAVNWMTTKRQGQWECAKTVAENMSEEWRNAQHMTKPVQSVSNKTTFILSAYKQDGRQAAVGSWQ